MIPGETIMSAAACPPEATDEELLRQFRRTGDAAAFETLVHRYEHDLFGYLRRYLRSVEMAEDVFQATFIQVHLKRESFVDGRLFRPWLYAIATHQAIDAQRRNRRHRMVELDRRQGDEEGHAFVTAFASRDATADDQAETEETRRQVRSAIDGLTAPQRMVVELVYDQGLKYREVASRIGIPVGTVKSRVRAALLKLGESWHRSPARGRSPALAARGLAT
jgi:RNA polymerase sigma-70 factor (ECF subfamily)